jgi:hypothetical protein
MDKVIWHFGNPDFGFPRDAFDMLAELSEGRESSHEYFASTTITKHCIQFDHALGCHRAVRGHDLNQK